MSVYLCVCVCVCVYSKQVPINISRHAKIVIQCPARAERCVCGSVGGGYLGGMEVS